MKARNEFMIIDVLNEIYNCYYAVFYDENLWLQLTLFLNTQQAAFAFMKRSKKSD